MGTGGDCSMTTVMTAIWLEETVLAQHRVVLLVSNYRRCSAAMRPNVQIHMGGRKPQLSSSGSGS
jgi:hypothetical protein